MKKYFMPIVTLALGVTLNAVGIIAFMLSDGQKTALIPAFFGGAFLILGGMAFSQKLRMHSVHGALALCLILGAYCLYKIPVLLANDETALKMFSFETTAIACIAYLVLGIRSFKQARRARKDAAIAQKAADKAEAAAQV